MTNFEAFVRSWPYAPWLTATLGLVAYIYWRGWLSLRRQSTDHWHVAQPAAFLGGLATIYLALASPIEPFASLLFQVHMLQHLLLMMAAPALIWLGAPLIPMLRGVPRPIRDFWLTPLFNSRMLREVVARLTHPAVALPIFVAATWLWHTPPLYELALRASGWHYAQHGCFLGSGLLFWYPVIRPYPSHPRWSTWLVVPYLILADVQNTVLSALLTFSGQVLYPYYLSVPHVAGGSVLADQSAAGVLMWVPGSLAFLLPLFGIGIRLLSGEERNTSHPAPVAVNQTLDIRSIRLPLAPGSSPPGARRHTVGFDLLRVPLIGWFLRWQHARLALQLPLAALAALLILDGLCGPQVGAMNLAGVLPWIHWRGLLILSLLAAGNFFCLACPFTLPRTVARRWLPAGRNWPRWLRSKWLAAGLLVVFLWAYEAFSLWDSPWWTAWLALGYFAAALLIDGIFRGAAFCKYVCPIGQFNFVQSLVSPLEVKVLDEKTCATCQSQDCINGRGDIPGCELHLFQPRKSGNMDCTFCLDCVHACPHANVGILARPPGIELVSDASRSGVGRFSKRPDLAVLVIVLVFGAFANAAGMVGPVVAWRDRLDRALGLPSPLLVTTLGYLVMLIILPLLIIGTASVLSRRWGQLTENRIEVATRFSYALVPIGFAMWLAHYSFHFATSYDTIVPVTVRLVRDFGLTSLAKPHWLAGCCRAVADWLLLLEILSLDFGLLLSLYTGYRISQAQSPRLSQALSAFAPWAVLIVLLFAAGIWLVFQPMQMRGTL